MYVNKCIKCGAEFETKNPKRVICPNCLYSDKKYTEGLSQEAATASTEQGAPKRNSYSFGSDEHREERPAYRSYDRADRPQRYDRGDRPQYNRDNRGGGYNRYNNDRPRDNRNQNGGFRPRPNNGGQRPQRQGGFNNNRPSGGFRPRPNAGGRPKPQRQKQLLVSKEQIEQIEISLSWWGNDARNLEPRKVFFGINLVRQKLMLPKLPFPKRKLAVSPDQLFAIKNLYEPLLPLPPIGCHKIIAAQLRMDEWRVHVGIGLIRKQMGLDRWNQEREDAPEEYKKTK